MKVMVILCNVVFNCYLAWKMILFMWTFVRWCQLLLFLRNELLGLAGVVKITNPEERLNHNHEPTENATSVVSVHNNTRDSNDINRRLLLN